MVGDIKKRLSGKKGKGMLASQKERLSDHRRNMKKEIDKRLGVPGIPGLKLTEKKKQKLLSIY